MEQWGNDGLRILAQYVRKTEADASGQGPVAYAESLRVDGLGLIPRAGPKYCVQVSIGAEQNACRFPLPAEFNRQKFFIIRAADLPVTIPYDGDARVSVIETDRKGERILAQSPVRFRTV